MKQKFSIGKVLQYVILVAGAIVALLPILVVFIGSFKTNKEFLSSGVLDLPKSFDFSNYKTAFVNGQMLLGCKIHHGEVKSRFCGARCAGHLRTV